MLIVDGRLRPDATRLAAALACQDVGIVIIWIGSDHRAVPAAVAHLATIDADGRTGELLAHQGGERSHLAPSR